MTTEQFGEVLNLLLLLSVLAGMVGAFLWGAISWMIRAVLDGLEELSARRAAERAQRFEEEWGALIREEAGEAAPAIPVGGR